MKNHKFVAPVLVVEFSLVRPQLRRRSISQILRFNLTAETQPMDQELQQYVEVWLLKGRRPVWVYRVQR